MLEVDDYDRIRRMVYVEGKSQREASRELGRSRKTVKKALKHSVPPGYRRRSPPKRPAIDPYRAIIDGWLEADKSAPRKQRHTGERIYERLKAEHEYAGSPSSVRRYLRLKRKGEVEAYFPLSFDSGEEAQFDWGDGWIDLNGARRKVNIFCARMCYSTASFVRAYPGEGTEYWLDGHVRAYEFFGGVPRRQAYDNLKTAVVKVGRGRERELTSKFKELRSHYLFEARFCNVESGNEKGHVENLVKWAQRRFLTPVPCVTSLEGLNVHLGAECARDLDRAVKARGGRLVRELLDEERARMLPLPAVAFEAARRESTFASKQSLVRFDLNDYSVPIDHALQAVQVKGFPDRVEIYAGAELIARHERSHGKGAQVLDPVHYVRLLERKPGGLKNGSPFKGEAFGAELAEMRKELEYRYNGAGTKQYIAILQLFNRYPAEEVRRAVGECLRKGAVSSEAVFGVLNYVAPRAAARLDLGRRPDLAGVGEAIRPMGVYDNLLTAASRDGAAPREALS